MALLDNKLWDTLGNGELPVIKVEIEKSSIINIALAAVIVITITILVSFFFKKTTS